MDGKRKESIKAWFDAVVHEGERGRGHELHIDQIDESWEPKPTWMSAALESFDIARGIRGDHQCDTQFTVVVALFLSEDSFPLGRTFHNRKWRWRCPTFRQRCFSGQLATNSGYE